MRLPVNFVLMGLLRQVGKREHEVKGDLGQEEDSFAAVSNARIVKAAEVRLLPGCLGDEQLVQAFGEKAVRCRTQLLPTHQVDLKPCIPKLADKAELQSS